VDEISTNFQRKDSGMLPPPPAAVDTTTAAVQSTPANADHVYYELAAVATPPNRKPVKFLPQRSLDPVMAGGTENFPVAIVDSGETGTVSSALTGPFAVDTDTDEEDDVRAEAVRHEWVQGSLLNRDIDDRMKELLDEDQKLSQAKRRPSPTAAEFTDTTSGSKVKGRRSPGTPETAQTEASRTPTFSPQVNKGCGTWEWLNIMCTSFLDPNAPSPTRTEEKDKTVYAEPISPNPAEELAAAKQVARPVVTQAAPTAPKKSTANKATAKRDVVVLESQEVETSYGDSPKIDTHEGVRQRLAVLRRQAERDNQSTPNRQDVGKTTTTVKAVAEEAAPKTKKSKPRAVSPLKKAFFRKKNVRVVTQKSPRRQATPGTPQAKKTGLMKLFRRGADV
jgi:hypothetical protein